MKPEVQPKSRRRGSYKRWFDITILTVAHLAMLPLWLALWTLIPVAIWLYDRGPIFYKQKRKGLGGKIIEVRKFRTMVPNAEALGPAWTLDGDKRLTPIGKVLRRTALDELPEILSIWKGDMSLVGPRALAVTEHLELEQRIPGFADRLQVLPGLTGLAQVYDKNDDAEEKYRYDLEYLNSLSLFMDIRLLTLSVWNTIRGRWDHRSGKGMSTGSEPIGSDPESSGQDSTVPEESQNENDASRHSGAKT